MEEGIDTRLPGLLYEDDLDLCGESKEESKVRVGCFVGMCRRRGLIVNANNSKLMMLFGEEVLECEIHVDEGNWSKCQSSNI